jgi:dephospho-CoA kinase
VRYLGLTGGIASGKSTASRAFRDAGAAVIDADQVAREVVAPGTPGLERLRQAFGPGILTPEGELDRGALGRLVFPDPRQRARLEAIVHPLVAAAAAERRRELHARAPHRLVVYDVPLLYEVGLEGEFDRVVVVYVPRAVQVERLLARDGLSRAEAAERLAAQMDIEEKARRADEVLDNTGSRLQLRRQVAALVARLQGEPPPIRVDIDRSSR